MSRILDFFDGFSSASDPVTVFAVSDALQETPTGLVNGSNTVFTLTYAPLTINHILVFVDGVQRIKTTEWGLSGTTVTFVTAPETNQQVTVFYIHSGTITPFASEDNVEEFVLTGTDITNKYVTLANSPTTPTDVLLFLYGGSIQRYTVDFVITGGNQLSWNGTSLDGFLSAGDVLITRYVSA